MKARKVAPVVQPISHYEFCKRYRDECTVKPVDQSPLPISTAILNRLAELTVEVNKAVRPVSDAELHGQDEYWTYPEKAGNCEEYALEKQRILRAEGISPANLLITVVRKPDGEGHADMPYSPFARTAGTSCWTI